MMASNRIYSGTQSAVYTIYNPYEREYYAVFVSIFLL